MKLAITSLLVLGVLSLIACGPASLQPAALNGIAGKWRSADGTYDVEFMANGNCSASYRMQGRVFGGPCMYTADKDTITIHYYGLDAKPQNGPNATATWRYSLAGDVLNVSVFGNSMALQRAH